MASRTVATLHVTNGDAVLYLFRKAGILGSPLPWRDVLHEGPVPAGLSLDELSRLRANYLAGRGYGKPIKVFHDFEARDAVIKRANEFEEVILWFEHDLYDQLQILQILTVLQDLSLEPGRVSLIQSDTYLGSMTADELAALHPKRRTVTNATFIAARRAWDAFRSSDPDALYAELGRDVPGLPYLRPALRRLCEEYPWTRDGLSRSERQALESVARGAAREEELFKRAQSHEEAPFLGDRSFYAILRDLRQGPAPLLESEDGMLVPNALGRRLLAGDADWLEIQPVDRWIGGVHVRPEAIVRWDDDTSLFKIARGAVDS